MPRARRRRLSSVLHAAIFDAERRGMRDKLPRRISSGTRTLYCNHAGCNNNVPGSGIDTGGTCYANLPTKNSEGYLPKQTSHLSGKIFFACQIVFQNNINFSVILQFMISISIAALYYIYVKKFHDN